jgi:DNA-binding NarL/FixJ family response regulator
MAEAATTARAEFTTRERDVYELICTGLATRAIARELHISPKTVETHRMRINKKLGTHSTREIILRRIIELGENEDADSAAERLEAVMLLARRALAGTDPKGARS